MIENPQITGKKARSLFLWMGAVAVLLGIAMFGGFTWYSANSPCEVGDVEYASAVLLTQMRRYDDVYASAANGTRTSIDYPVTVMQQILVDTQEVEVPTCMQEAKGELIGYMGDAIRAFKAFQSEESDTNIQDLLNSSYAHVRAFRIELEAIKECAPYCKPWK